MRSFIFSASGGTKKTAQYITDAMGRTEERDLVVKPLREDIMVGGGDAVLMAAPVYAGRIPPVCREMLRHIKGDGNPAIAVVSYGNRDYEDALLELVDLMEEQGFQVVGAGAFVAQHSIFSQVGKDRPDQQDRAGIEDFAARCKAAVETFSSNHYRRIWVKGNTPYRAAHGVPFQPTGNQNCIKCRACVARCPVGAIPGDDPKKTDEAKCISCGACIYICPVEARGYFTPAYRQAAEEFTVKCAARREPELFF